MHKHKPHKGLLKRIRVTKKGKVKVRVANGSHLRSGKPADRLRHFRQTRYLNSRGVLKRISKLLGQRVTPAQRGPEQTPARGQAGSQADAA